jgi:hypothetical protein
MAKRLAKDAAMGRLNIPTKANGKTMQDKTTIPTRPE